MPKDVAGLGTPKYEGPNRKADVKKGDGVYSRFCMSCHGENGDGYWRAVESGRRAAKAIDDRVEVLDQYQPPWINILSRIDDILFTLKAPQLIDSLFIALILALVLILLTAWR